MLSTLLCLALTPGAPVTTAADLAAAVRDSAEGATIEVAAGTFELDAVLELKARTTLRGAGVGKTILTAAPGRTHSSKSLPDPEMRLEGLDADAYLIRIKRDSAGVAISDLTLRGPGVHGAVFAWFPTGLRLHRLRVENTQWSGIRTFGMKGAKIHDCEFVDAGGRWDGGKPGVKGGITGGAIFAIWMRDCEIFDNRFTRTQQAPEREFYGIKVRQAVNCRVHHNTIEANFSMEFPFENDTGNELDHNVCHGTISLPKYAGGIVLKSGRTFHIHHNYFKDSYSIEFVRNAVEIDHNLFDFDPKADHGNLISAFGEAAAPGPLWFHHNHVHNPGRGVMWMNEPYNHVEVRNNHVRCRTTKTPRVEGLFGFHSKCDFRTHVYRDNVIECEGQARPLFRESAQYAASVENNRLVNVADAGKLTNAPADRPVGLTEPLKFDCGAKGEFTVDGWKLRGE